MNIITLLEGAGTLIATMAALAIIYATLRSKLPATTIQIQTESIAALEKQNSLLRENVDALNKLVNELRTRVSVLETIPLKTMTDSLTALAASVDQLIDIGHTNQALMQTLVGAPTNTTINNH